MFCCRPARRAANLVNPRALARGKEYSSFFDPGGVVLSRKRTLLFYQAIFYHHLRVIITIYNKNRSEIARLRIKSVI